MLKTRSENFKNELIKKVAQYVENLEIYSWKYINFFTLTDENIIQHSCCSVSIMEPKLSKTDILYVKKQEDMIIKFLFIIEKRNRNIIENEKKLNEKVIRFERIKYILKEEPNDIFWLMRTDKKIIYKKKLQRTNKRLMIQINNLKQKINDTNQKNTNLKNKIELKKMSLLSLIWIVDIWNHSV